jgi:hypothetical protein
MPRGQYDRSKSKAQRAAEKNAEAPKSTVKKARAPYGSKKLAKAAGASTAVREFTEGGAESYSLEQLAQLRGCFSNPVNTNLISKIDTLITAKLDRMLGEIEVTKKTLQTSASAPSAPIQQAPAPIPFNPAVPSNGQA